MPARKVNVINLFKKKPLKKTGSSPHAWQRAQTSRKKRKTWRKIFFGMFVFGLFTTLYFVNNFRAIVANSFHPLPTNISYKTNPSTNYRVNILLISTKGEKSLTELVLASYSHTDGTIKWLKIPTGVYLDLPSDYGWGSLSSAFLLGQTEATQKGVDVLVRGVGKLLAVPVDGYIAFDQDSLSLNEPNLEKVRKSLFGFHFFLGAVPNKLWIDNSLHSSLTPMSLVKLSFDIKNVRFDKAGFKDLADFATEAILDNQKYPLLDILSLDAYLKDNLAETAILLDLAKIEVRNGSNVAGLAQLAARVITNLGGNVVYTGNAEQDSVKSAVITYGKKDQTAVRLGQVLGAKVENKKDDSTVRGDIVIQVGQDFFDRLSLK